MEGKKVTIHDIAKALNITASTVSRALNNHAKISVATKKTVRQKANEMGYKPNSLAASLRRGKSNTIGLVVPRINRFFFADTIAGIESVTNPAGYNLVICQSDEKIDKERENIQTLIRNQVDGIIISLSQETTDCSHLAYVREIGIPLVLFDRTRDDLDANQVVNDNFDSSRLAVKHLADQGYQRIAYFAGPQNTKSYLQRAEGYMKGLEDNGLAFDPALFFKDSITKVRGIERAEQILKMKKRPDAILSAGDFSALGAHIVFKKAGIKIPDEIAIVGYANEPFTEFIDPPITSVDLHGVELGKITAKMLLDEIDDDSNTPTIPKILTVRSNLVVRKSSERAVEDAPIA